MMFAEKIYSSGFSTCSNKAAFKDGDFCWQSRMVDSILAAVEKHMIGVKLVSRYYLCWKRR